MNKNEGLKAEMERVQAEYRNEIAQKIVDHPELSYETVAREYNVSLGWVARLVRERGIGRKADKAANNDLMGEQALTAHQKSLLPKMAECTHAKYGCASGDVWIGLANEFHASEYDAEQEHEKAAQALEANNDL